MKKKVSVIVPIYNVEKYIHRCVDSILNQTYQNIEVILVDDGSPDNCAEICDVFEKKDNRVTVIHKENGGLSDARNFGIDSATGHYLLFVDGDDYIESQLIETAVEQIEKNNADMVIWGYYADFVDEEENLLESQKKVPTKQIYDSTNNSFNINEQLIGFFGYAWNKLYKTKQLKSNNYKFEKGLSLVEDIVFNSPVLSSCNRVVILDDAFVHYMQRPRDTLGSQYYSDFFELKKRAMVSLKNVLRAWEVAAEDKNRIMNQIGFNNINSAIKMILLSDKDNKEKRRLVDVVRNDKISLSIFEKYKPKSLKYKVQYYLIKWKKYHLLNYIYNIKK